MREVIELQRQGFALDIYSMFGGYKNSKAGPVYCMSWMDWFVFVFELLYWLIVRPVRMLVLIGRLFAKRYGSWINFAENLLGFAFGVCFARRFIRHDYRCAHATWATGPGMAVYVLKDLTGLSYTMEAHAYDVFRDGGDAFLVHKCKEAKALRSSTETTRRKLESCFGTSITTQVSCVRRGLFEIPLYRTPTTPVTKLHVLSVGRLIEKKGYLQQLEIYRELLTCGMPFHVNIVGEGPLKPKIEARIAALGLGEYVTLAGKLEYPQVEAMYAQANLFLFSGVVAASGDRDGFPNVIGEAMAHSLPVFTTDVSGTTEGVPHDVRGTVIDLAHPQQTAAHIVEVMQDALKLERLTHAAHAWVLTDFQVGVNMQRLRQVLWGAPD